MRLAITCILGIAVLAALMAQQTSQRSSASVLQFTNDGQLVLPANYREWVFLSSGLGMIYGPAAEANPSATPRFDNVFVNPAAYQSFLATGKWPDQTMFVLEIRASASKGSINNGGHYQTDMLAIEAEVKDTSRFPGAGWAFYALGKATTGKLIPKTAACYTCHPEKGAVDNTFVQFYPALLKVAKEKGTLNPAYVAASAAEDH